MSELNGVMMQYFHWYNEPDGSLWNEVADNAKDLADVGITALWLPPAYKGNAGGYDVGYSVYDLYDLGSLIKKEAFVQNTAAKTTTCVRSKPPKKQAFVSMPTWS